MMFTEAFAALAALSALCFLFARRERRLNRIQHEVYMQDSVRKWLSLQPMELISDSQGANYAR